MAGEVLNMCKLALNKHQCKMKICVSKPPQNYILNVVRMAKKENRTLLSRFEKLKKRIENIDASIESCCKKKLVFANALLPYGQLRKPTHIAHICKSHKLTHKLKFAKECSFSDAQNTATIRIATK